jgi:N-acetylmuramoyl-L-alanine amidase
MMPQALGGIAMRTAVVLLALIASACAPLQPRTNVAIDERAGVPVERRPSPNFDERRPGFVILHHTSDASAEDSLRVLTNAARGVSSHYLVGRDGRIFSLVDEKARAWHAGESSWGGERDLNSSSIGIELDNDGKEPFAEAQIDALLALLAEIKARYKIPGVNFLGHGDIAPGRKVDPSRYFPWKRLAEKGFGAWCEAPYPAVPPGIDDALLLQAFGYSVWNIDAAVAAFKRHFTPDDPSPQMTEKDRSLLYCLVLQNRAPTGE